MNAVARLGSRPRLLGLALVGAGAVLGLVVGADSANAAGCFR